LYSNSKVKYVITEYWTRYPFQIIHWKASWRVFDMDLFSAEQLNGRFWSLAKQGAFLCFVIACALLGASLVLPGSGVVDGVFTTQASISSPPPR
jgi:hypothetical protein